MYKNAAFGYISRVMFYTLLVSPKHLEVEIECPLVLFCRKTETKILVYAIFVFKRGPSDSIKLQISSGMKRPGKIERAHEP